MNPIHNTSDIDALETLLEAERTALLQGDLAVLTDMLPQKEALIDALNAQVTDDVPTLQDLGARIQRNQALLDGALEGIRDVAKRVSDLRRARGGIDTYTAQGARHHIEVQTDHSVERRA